MEKSGMKTMALRQVWEENFLGELEFIRQVVLRHNYVTVATRVIPLRTAPTPASSAAVAAARATRVIPLPTAPSPASSAAARATRVIPLPTAPSPASSAAARATRVIPLPTAPSPASSAAARATRVILLPTAPSPASSSAAAAGATLPTLDENYAFFRQRANAVRLLQLGLTFSDEGGNLPKDPMTGEGYLWEFNVKVAKSMDEIDAVFRQHLTEKGINVDYNMKYGIHPDMLCTGIGCMETLKKERIRWVVFSGCAAFSPLLNIMRPVTGNQEQLPVRREAFLDAVKLYFPKFYELRQLMSGCGLSGTLVETANVLGVGVTGGEMFNQAGPDSLLTLQVFLGLRKRHFRRGIPEDQANLINYLS
ncbi:putative CCR4-associated factor 1-like protein 9 [Nymphaea thermarum]|nr:putative CCR4-associated factor 1-like protein 9 [Nymphaea thermarum]